MHTEIINNNGRCSETLVRDRLADRFMLIVTDEYDDVGILPKGFIKAKYYADRSAYLYVIWPLVPVIWLSDWVVRLWYLIPCYLRRNGHLDVPPNEHIPRLWFSRVRFLTRMNGKKSKEVK